MVVTILGYSFGKTSGGIIWPDEGRHLIRGVGRGVSVVSPGLGVVVSATLLDSHLLVIIRSHATHLSKSIVCIIGSPIDFQNIAQWSYLLPELFILQGPSACHPKYNNTIKRQLINASSCSHCSSHSTTQAARSTHHSPASQPSHVLPPSRPVFPPPFPYCLPVPLASLESSCNPFVVFVVE